MKKAINLLFIVSCVVMLASCSEIGRERPLPQNDLSIKEADLKQDIYNINGVEVKDGSLYFTGRTEEGFNYYLINNGSQEEVIFEGLENYEWFTPLKERDALYVDYKSQLYHLAQEKRIKIDEGVSGVKATNVIVSPDRKAVLYTKTTEEKDKLILLSLDNYNLKVIKDELSEDQLEDFVRTTHWSENGGYFVLNNKEIYNKEGGYIAEIDALSLKWAPNDELIAYIKTPATNEENSIIVSETKTNIGSDFCIFSLKDLNSKALFSTREGLLNVNDVIQWNDSSNRVAIAVGNIKKIDNHFEGIDYKKILVFDLEQDKTKILDNMDYNFYKFIFDDYITAYSLGKREPLLVMNIATSKTKLFNGPLMLNSRDMFVISQKNKGYLVNNNNLMEIDSKGKEKMIYTFPWEVKEVYYDPKHNSLIIINNNEKIYWLKI
ncbi:hypothetical protein F8154_00250 [Alkaliphilus pronyensis]|uniref:Uncharacterized protein n=1 Tax=Alkaliphilus pronyensis TaxID=1482732 RepID=A0A6I0FEV3_9FIRM|nr:hypothetical protein [Alkaliphilus pronyensis]KAB3540985.1 hypothetical protein F8154_00250 [Alkaliphilus pronyensis]